MTVGAPVTRVQPLCGVQHHGGNLICVTRRRHGGWNLHRDAGQQALAVNADREETFVSSATIRDLPEDADMTVYGEISVLTFNNAGGSGALVRN
ncbi:hypothetical protein MASR1M6_27130 [Rubrivivax sp.]